jgi:hypothetical protein
MTSLVCTLYIPKRGARERHLGPVHRRLALHEWEQRSRPFSGGCRLFALPHARVLVLVHNHIFHHIGVRLGVTCVEVFERSKLRRRVDATVSVRIRIGDDDRNRARSRSFRM